MAQDDPFSILELKTQHASALADRFSHLDGRELWLSGIEGKLLFEQETILASITGITNRFNVKKRQIVFVVDPRAAERSEIRQVMLHLRAAGFRVVLGEADPVVLDARSLVGERRWFDVLRVPMKLLPAADSELAQALRHIFRCYNAMGFKITANNVDTVGELATIRAYGLSVFQGTTGLADSGETPAARAATMVPQMEIKTIAAAPTSRGGTRLGELSSKIDVVSPLALIRDVLPRLSTAQYLCLPVTSAGSVIGVLRAATVFGTLAECYRMRETCDQEVEWLVEHDIPIRDYLTPISSLEQFISNHNPMTDAGVLVTRREEYYGFVPMDRLVRAKHDEDVANARGSNVLTGLPGSNAMAAAWDRYVATHAGETPLVAVVDLDYFKSFNDSYGPMRGDEIIQALALTIKDVTAPHVSVGAHVSHIGGDDFLVLLPPAAEMGWKENIKDRWTAAKRQFFRQEDIERGYFVGQSRQGQLTKVPLAEITVAVAAAADYNAALDRAWKLKAEMRKGMSKSSAGPGGGILHA